MTFIYKCLSLVPNSMLPLNRFAVPMLIWLVALLPSVAIGQALVIQVSGEVTLNVPGVNKAIDVKAGTLLAGNNSYSSSLQFTSKESQLWLLCSGLDELVNIREVKHHKPLCPAQSSSKMRGREDDNVPFLILPNQQALTTLSRVLWSGPKGADYLIMLMQYDDLGRPSLVNEWEADSPIYHESGFHELLIEPALSLSFSKDHSLTYKIEIENTDNSQTSARFDEILINPITRAFTEDIALQAYALLGNQKIGRDTDLGKLIYASYLSGKGYFAQAYTVASSLGNSHYKSAAQWLKAKALYQPGTPSTVVVREFIKSLEVAVASHDYATALVACQSLLSPANSLLDTATKKRRNKIVANPEYARFCKK